MDSAASGKARRGPGAAAAAAPRAGARPAAAAAPTDNLNPAGWFVPSRGLKVHGPAHTWPFPRVSGVGPSVLGRSHRRMASAGDPRRGPRCSNCGTRPGRGGRLRQRGVQLEVALREETQRRHGDRHGDDGPGVTASGPGSRPCHSVSDSDLLIVAGRLGPSVIFGPGPPLASTGAAVD